MFHADSQPFLIITLHGYNHSGEVVRVFVTRTVGVTTGFLGVERESCFVEHGVTRFCDSELGDGIVEFVEHRDPVK